MLYTLHKRNQSKFKLVRLSVLRSKFTNSFSFLKQQISFSSNFASKKGAKRAYQSTHLVKFHVSSWKSEILHCDRLLLSKSYKVLAKKVQKNYLSWHWRVIQSLKKKWLSNMAWGIRWIFTQPLNSLDISLWWALFAQSIYFMTLNSDAKFE